MKNVYRLAALALSSGFALTAFAQSGAPEREDDTFATPSADQRLELAAASGIEEISVTSRRRADRYDVVGARHVRSRAPPTRR